jgi:hypothetical protein
VLHPHHSADASAVMLTVSDGGQVVALEGVERVRAMPEVQRLYVFAAEGDIVRPYEEAGHKLGYVVLRADSPAELHRAEHALQETLAIRLAPSDDGDAVGWP